ncbi:hypothetical protein SH584_09445 [Sphingomonas sp. LY29]|uniref:hypothetical protein n=1 Tax=Sphingomonas sp. LY29 TaxID=3095341 RepID=UPI002D77CE6E|nr:hypothetical protein [Sphingomonas sp. LY29]WRP25268.1 hypothetical protein SH584_09445 [Sphingomonas sp. LY29]
MRNLILSLPLLLAAVPAAAQTHPAPMPPAPVAVPPAISDPALPERLGNMTGALTRGLMNLPVGELQAAIEGRPATPNDRARTVRDTIGDPYLDQRVAAEAATTGRTMQAATRALMSSLPAIMGALEGARGEIERAMATIPNPTYPVR